ncbi:hypothetical protein GX48_03226 [Paracoccidioides brasiliensis]|nr:hypothetical protein GX48_03226 [Paracoccidioides brasiliensis]
MSDSPLGCHSNFSALNKPEVAADYASKFLWLSSKISRETHLFFVARKRVGRAKGVDEYTQINDGTLASTIALDDSWTCHPRFLRFELRVRLRA